MKGMCHQCYTSGIGLNLTEINGMVENQLGSVFIPLCDKCRK
ncbi:MAG: hypothetical protein OEQ94_02160 [Nitrosopumilus sp.]|nr:hypothetical protein [Nitrosopumilus sp.]